MSIIAYAQPTIIRVIVTSALVIFAVVAAMQISKLCTAAITRERPSNRTIIYTAIYLVVTAVAAVPASRDRVAELADANPLLAVAGVAVVVAAVIEDVIVQLLDRRSIAGTTEEPTESAS